MQEITKEGLEKLQAELRQLKEVERPKVIERLSLARSYGDLSENAEYEDARERQAFIELRLHQLEKMIHSVKVVYTTNTDLVGLGNQVEVEISGQKSIYHLVSPNEAAPSDGKISHESPLGRALINKSIGDKFNYQVPDGRKIFGQIINII